MNWDWELQPVWNTESGLFWIWDQHWIVQCHNHIQHWSVFKMNVNIRDETIESSQEEMICSKCSEKIIGKAMKVVSWQNKPHHKSSHSSLAGRIETLARGLLLVCRLWHQTHRIQGGIKSRLKKKEGVVFFRCSRRTNSSFVKWITRKGLFHAVQLAVASSWM